MQVQVVNRATGRFGLSPDQEAVFRDMWMRGTRGDDMAKTFGISRTTVTKIAYEDLNLPRRTAETYHSSIPNKPSLVPVRRPGDSLTWGLITQGTSLEGTPYPENGRV